MAAKWVWQLFLVLFVAVPRVVDAYIGVNIGPNMPSSPSDVVEFLKEQKVTHVRLYEAHSEMLTAFSDTSIEVIVGVTNSEVLSMNRSRSAAAAWINQNVVPYVNITNITAIAVGNEVLTTAPEETPLVYVMNTLRLGLIEAGLERRVKISTPISMGTISRPFPPSTASFVSNWSLTIQGILQYLQNTESYFMLNAYPYYGYVDVGGIFPLEYALFQPLSSGEKIVDPNTLYHYDSMLDSMVDAAYYSIQALGFSSMPIVVTGTGWPWQGGDNELYATLENAETYNNNLIARVLGNSGPPSKRDMPIKAYIHELFNKEDMARNETGWGIMFSNGKFVYPLVLTGSSLSSLVVFCIAKEDADSDKLRVWMDWACRLGHVDCSAIQQGQLCYYPDNLQNHASFAYNVYYQRMHSYGGTCDFDGTATTTSVDPSYGSCVFTGGSMNVSSMNVSGSSGSVSVGSGPVIVSPLASPAFGRSSKILPATGCFIVGIIFSYFTL